MFGKQATELKIPTVSWGGTMKQTKKRTQTTHRKTPLALPQHSSTGSFRLC